MLNIEERISNHEVKALPCLPSAFIIDVIVRSQKTPFFIIPVDAGIQKYQGLLDPGACPGPDPGFAGVTA
jgi:hypothetical protein